MLTGAYLLTELPTSPIALPSKTPLSFPSPPLPLLNPSAPSSSSSLLSFLSDRLAAEANQSAICAATHQQHLSSLLQSRVSLIAHYSHATSTVVHAINIAHDPVSQTLRLSLTVTPALPCHFTVSSPALALTTSSPRIPASNAAETCVAVLYIPHFPPPHAPVTLNIGEIATSLADTRAAVVATLVLPATVFIVPNFSETVELSPQPAAPSNPVIYDPRPTAILPYIPPAEHRSWLSALNTFTTTLTVGALGITIQAKDGECLAAVKEYVMKCLPNEVTQREVVKSEDEVKRAFQDVEGVKGLRAFNQIRREGLFSSCE